MGVSNAYSILFLMMSNDRRRVAFLWRKYYMDMILFDCVHNFSNYFFIELYYRGFFFIIIIYQATYNYPSNESV